MADTFFFRSAKVGMKVCVACIRQEVLVGLEVCVVALRLGTFVWVRIMDQEPPSPGVNQNATGKCVELLTNSNTALGKPSHW
jgi:hypothetical protein